MPTGLRGALSRRLGADARALAAFRVALALLLLADLARRAGSVVAFHTDGGVLPRAVVAAEYPTLSGLSVHALSGGASLQLALFALAGLAACCLLVGYRTRLATLVSLLLLVSVHARAPVILNGGDTLLRRLLFWGLFLPLGARWSLDADGRSGNREWVASAATAGLLVQVVIVYAVNAGFKHASPVWGSGDALRYVFRLDQYTWFLGEFLPGHPELLGALGALWMALLAASPLLFFLTGRRRVVAVCVFAGAHVSMALTMHLYLFPFVSLAALLPFLPGGVWDRAEAALGSLPERLAAAAPDGEFRRGRFLPFSAGTRSKLLTGFVVCALLAATLWNAAALGYVAAPNDAVGDHSWRMFAGPPSTDVSVATNGTTAAGERVDPLRGGALEAAGERPYPSERWRRYFLVRWRADNSFDALGPYLCSRWNRSHADGLAGLTVDVHARHLVLDGPDRNTTERVLTHDCRG
jgi:hypothetical protein